MKRNESTIPFAVLTAGIALGIYAHKIQQQNAVTPRVKVEVVRVPRVFNPKQKVENTSPFPFVLYGIVIDETNYQRKTYPANRELSRVRFGMSRREVSRVAPTAAKWAQGSFTPRNRSILTFQFTGPNQTLNSFAIQYPTGGRALQGTLHRRFGSGTPFNGRTIWNQPGTSVRTEFEPQGQGGMITLTPYVSVEQFVSPEDGSLGSEEIPTIGSTKEELIAAYAPNVFEDGDKLVILTPPIEFSSAPTESIVSFDESGHASGFTISSRFDLDPFGATMLAGLMENRFGEPTLITDETEQFLSEENTFDLASNASEEVLSISVGLI